MVSSRHQQKRKHSGRKKNRQSHDSVVARLKAKQQSSRELLQSKFAHAVATLNKLEFDFSRIRHRSAQVVAATALAGAVMATNPDIAARFEQLSMQQETETSADKLQQRLRQELQHVLPRRIGPLSPQMERHISEVIAQTLGISATAELEQQHLNTSYGYIGAEQHLPRFPGDAIGLHDALQHKGITANRGAFGYFARSRSELTQEQIDQEKYYVAVQTLYLPNWNRDHRWLKDWYKFRKVLVVNPVNGKAMVAVVGDAGPAAWTGKQFGGSPELMEYLQLKDGRQKGAVLLFFVDEENGHIALGPVEAKHAAYLASN